MRLVTAVLRRSPGPLVGSFVALVAAALVVTVAACLVGTSSTMTVPAQRLAATTVVVTGNQNVRVTSGSGDNATTDVVPLPDYRRVPASLAAQVASLPGVAVAIPDISIPLALQLADGHIVAGGATGIIGHAWQSAVLTPFTLSNGHAPDASSEIVVGGGLAGTTGLHVGSTVRVAGANLPSFTVAGIASSAHNTAENSSAFFSTPEADRLYAHAGQADLIGVIARPGISPATLAASVRKALAASDLRVLTGTERGQAENLAVALDKANLSDLATGAGIDMVLIALFAAAAAIGLSIAQRRRQFALLRAVGATPGQVRRIMLAELAVLGGLAGLVSYLPGTWLTAAALHALAAQQFVPAAAKPWTSPWVLLIATGASIVLAELAGFVASRRASRVNPAEALRDAAIERRWPPPIRTGLGVIALAGGVAICVATLKQHSSADSQLSLSFATLLVFMAAVGLLGPLIVGAAELIARLPLRLVAGVAGRLALADTRARPRRMSAAVVSIALAVAFISAQYLLDATQTHGALVQGRQRLVADQVASAPGPGLAPDALHAIATQPGVASAVALAPTIVFVPDPGSDQAVADAITPGRLSSVLDLLAVSGSLQDFRAGDIALSNLVAGNGAMNAHVGQHVTVYLADGTPYRATVTAIYARSLGFADVLVPAAVTAGHLATTALGQILIHDSDHAPPMAVSHEIATLASRYPGLTVGTPSVVNAQAEQLTAQTTYINNLLLAVLGLLVAVAIVNTLVMLAVERREHLRLLLRLGATPRQLLSMTTWQTLVVTTTGTIIGAGAATATVIAAAKALTGSYQPYLTWPPVALIVGTALALVAAASLGPTAAILIAQERGSGAL